MLTFAILSDNFIHLPVWRDEMPPKLIKTNMKSGKTVDRNHKLFY